MQFRTAFLRSFGALAALVCFLAVGARAETTNALSDAEIQGRQLAQQILEQRPATNLTQAGILSIRGEKKNRVDMRFIFAAYVYPTKWFHHFFPTNWQSDYQVFPTNGLNEELVITHGTNSLNRYYHHAGSGIGRMPETEDQHEIFPGTEDEAFANSDFCSCDLGLGFLHWPAQKILPKSTNLKRGREYTLLESTNPTPPANGYSRVLSWIDKESGGILAAEAYDAKGKLLLSLIHI